MAKLVFVLFSVVFLMCATAQTSSKKGVVIQYADPATTTIFDISCDAFESVFSQSSEKIYLSKRDEINYVDSCLKLFKEDLEINGIDTRIKLIFNRGKQVDTFCLDYAGNFYVPRLNRYMVNEPLKDFILQKIDIPGWK